MCVNNDGRQLATRCPELVHPLPRPAPLEAATWGIGDTRDDKTFPQCVVLLGANTLPHTHLTGYALIQIFVTVFQFV